MKKSFALFIVLILLILFSTLTISIIETEVMSKNIDTLKYLHLQAKVHLKYIKEFIQNHTKVQINNFDLNDTRFKLQLILKDENNISVYHISIKTVDDTTISIYDTIIKK